MAYVACGAQHPSICENQKPNPTMKLAPNYHFGFGLLSFGVEPSPIILLLVNMCDYHATYHLTVNDNG